MLRRKSLLLLVIAPAAALAFLRLYQAVTGVGTVKVTGKVRRKKTKANKHRVATAHISGAVPEAETTRVEVSLYSVNDIYATVGISSADFIKWHEQYGYGTLGQTSEGGLFVPDYPVFSKIAEMGICPIDLSQAETAMLIEECGRARERSVSAAASAELDALIALGQQAVAVNGAVSFGLA